MSKNFVTKSELKARYKEANDRLRHQNNTLRAEIVNNGVALQQVSLLVDAILANVIEKYGENGQIEIKQPDTSVPHNVIAENNDGVYVIKLAEDGTEEPVRD